MHSFVEPFEKTGYYLFENFADSATCADIRTEVTKLYEQQHLKKAGIGKDVAFQIDNSQRGDFIQWIIREEAPSATLSFLRSLDELLLQLNRNFYLGIEQYECHYTHYPSGTFYKRHVDRHRNISHRIVSFVFYLNEQWTEADGGQLRIYDDVGGCIDVLPQCGRLAIFLSEKEHEVLITHRSRMSITGWMLQRADY